MKQIPRNVIDNYTRMLNTISGECRAVLADALERIDYSQDVATIRQQVVIVMEGVCGMATDTAAEVAATFYDGLRELELGSKMGAIAESGRIPEATDGAVRAFAEYLVDGNVDSFVNACLSRLDYEVKVAASQTCLNNAKRDTRKPRFARVPSGSDTCPFCLMLASRGFVYHTEAAAGHAHDNCDCRVTPSWKAHAVEGYDPDEYYDKWKNPEIYQGLDATTSDSLACLRVAEKRGQVVYDKPLLSFLETEDGKHDLFAHAALVRGGRRFRALAEDAPEGYSNIDLQMDGQKWEVKSPSGNNPRAVESNLRKAKKQFGKNYPEPIEEVRVIFNSGFYRRDDDWVSEEIARQLSAHRIENVIFVRKDGSVGATVKAQTPYSERPGL